MTDQGMGNIPPENREGQGRDSVKVISIKSRPAQHLRNSIGVGWAIFLLTQGSPADGRTTLGWDTENTPLPKPNPEKACSRANLKAQKAPRVRQDSRGFAGHGSRP